MAEPFLGEIRLFSFGIVPSGWALCNGQILNITQYQALFGLIGTRYGGDGRTTFNLPDLRGRVPMHFTSYNNNFPLGAAGGTEGVALTTANMGPHAHYFSVLGSAATLNAPSNMQTSVYAVVAPPTNPVVTNGFIYAPMPEQSPPVVPLNPSFVQTAGAGTPHNNMQPFAVLSFCIAVAGLWPSRN